MVPGYLVYRKVGKKLFFAGKFLELVIQRDDLTLLVTRGIATRSKDATRGSRPYY